MTDQSARTFSADFKRFFIRGLAVLLPTVLTLWILVQGYKFIDNAIAQPVNAGVRTAVTSLVKVWEPLRTRIDPTEAAVDAEIQTLKAAGGTAPVPDRQSIRDRLRAATVASWWTAHWYMDLIGLVVAIIAVYTAGRLLGGYFGRKIYVRIERLMTSIPFFKQVYPYVKRVVEFIFNEDKAIKFNRVVVVEYPRKGIWSLGFLTGESMRAVAEHAGDSVTVFIPHSPTPVTGYAMIVPRKDVIELDVSVEEAVMFVVSCGVLISSDQSMDHSGKARQFSAAVSARTASQRPLPGGGDGDSRPLARTGAADAGFDE